MTLGELKQSLNRFSHDLDDASVALLMLDKNEHEHYDALAFTAYVNVKGHENPVVLLGSQASVVKMMTGGKVRYPDGTNPADTKFDIN